MNIFSRFILAFTITIALGFIISTLYSRYKNRGEIVDTTVWSNTVPHEYLQLLKLQDSCCKSPNGNIVFVETKASKYRNPISYFFIADRYYLQVYKMDTSFNYSLNTAIKQVYSNAHTWTYTPYALDSRTDMEFLYKATKPRKPKSIFFDLYGDSTIVLKKNDTIAYYYSKCRNFSIKFNLQDQNDIYGECQSKSFSEVSLELMFLKRHKELFLLILSERNVKTDFKHGLLDSLFFRQCPSTQNPKSNIQTPK